MTNPRIKKGRYDGDDESEGRIQFNGKAGFLAEQRAIRNANRGNGSYIEWAGAPSGSILALIDRAVSRGCTITFAATRDKGALKLSLYDGRDRIDEYCRATEDVEVFVAMLIEMLPLD